MNFQKNTGKTIQEAFETYHKLNPNVFSYFEKYAFEAINTGKKKISAKLIINRIRWEIYMDTKEPTLITIEGELKAMKLNDAYSSRLSRMFVELFPEHKNIFNFRTLRA